MNWMAISALTALGGFLLTVFTTCVIVFFKYVLPNIKGGGTFIKNCVGSPENKKSGQPFVPSVFQRFDAQDENLERQNAVLASQNAVLASIDERVNQAVDQSNRAVQQVANSHPTNLRDDMDDIRDHVVSLHNKVDALTSPSPTTTINVNPNGGTP